MNTFERTERKTRGITHGKSSSHKVCSCSVCVEGHRVYQREYRARKWAAADFKHGTTFGYAVGCRCGACKETHRVSNRRSL